MYSIRQTLCPVLFRYLFNSLWVADLSKMSYGFTEYLLCETLCGGCSLGKRHGLIPTRVGIDLRAISYLSPCLLRGSIASFGGYRLLQRDSLLTQDWGRLIHQHNFYWISVVQAVDACCRWLDRPIATKSSASPALLQL